MAKWFEDESFWESFCPVLFPEEKLQASEEEVERILSLTGFRGRDVLDLCCGPGRHSVTLAKKGFRVTGVDRSPFLLALARTRAARERTSMTRPITSVSYGTSTKVYARTASFSST